MNKAMSEDRVKSADEAGSGLLIIIHTRFIV